MSWMLMRRHVVVVTGISVAAWLGPVVDITYAQTDDSTEVARVGDTVFTLSDIDDAWNQYDAAARFRMLQQLYDGRRRILDVVIGEQLVEREAAARGMSRKALLDVELPPFMLPITDEDVELVYERNRDTLGGQTLKDVRMEIEAALERQRPNQALNKFMAKLRQQAVDVIIFLEPPRQQVEVLPDDPSWGPSDAPLVFIEFSDFQCHFCQRATVTLKQLFERYSGQIRFIYKDYPLPSHPQAFQAAEAGNCAHEQGMFWQFHDKMFASQDALDVRSLNEYASELGLDPASFATCLDEGRYTERVQRDLEIGHASGVSSTPTVFINGRPVMGAMPIETFDQIIREELAASER